MSFAMIERRVLKNGDLVGTRLIKLHEKDFIVDAFNETKNLRYKALRMESRIDAAVSESTKIATRSATKKATLEVLTRHSAQQALISSAVERISKQLIESVVSALEVTLTGEQVAQILGHSAISQLATASLPEVAIRVGSDSLEDFEGWVTQHCPENIRAKVRVFPHDNIPLNCLVIRADAAVTEVALRPIISALAREAAASIAQDIGIEAQSHPLRVSS